MSHDDSFLIDDRAFSKSRSQLICPRGDSDGPLSLYHSPYLADVFWLSRFEPQRHGFIPQGQLAPLQKSAYIPDVKRSTAALVARKIRVTDTGIAPDRWVQNFSSGQEGEQPRSSLLTRPQFFRLI